ncbi:MAG: Hsp20 family protein [Acidobacteriia bacterium]|nr:Hsp20 family protein [Terriglobia bacterium]
MPSRLKSHLDQAKISYSQISHALTYSAQDAASIMHVPGKEVAKTVMLRTGEKTLLAVLPASFQINMNKLASIVGSGVRLATEAECNTLFPDCEPGAVPPFGELYGLPVYLDESLAEDPEIVFSVGTHSDAIRMGSADFVHLAKPKICSFADEGSRSILSATPTDTTRRKIMTNLARRGSFFGDLFDFRREFDEMFNRLLSEQPWGTARLAPSAPEVPAIDAWVDKEAKNYHVRLALPGVDPQNVQLNVQGNMLSISAERKESRESKDVNYLRREFSYGTLERTLELPEGTDTAKITAEYNNGVLEISAPIAAAALPRRIEIKTAPKSKTASA